MRVLQIGADRSKRGILVPGTKAYERQRAYADVFGSLDIIGFSRKGDGFKEHHDGPLHLYPTNSAMRLLYGIDALLRASKLPWPDVVSAQDPFEAGLTAYAISRFVQKPLHVQVHTDFLSPAYARHSLLNRFRVLVAGFVLRRAARVRVVSERIRISIQTRYALQAPVTVLPIYVDVGRFRALERDALLEQRFVTFSHRLLYVGRFEPEKDPCLALRAFARAAPKSTCLIMVGTGSEFAYVRALARDLGVADRVFFEGEADPGPYYAIADLVLVTSRYEGYGLVIIEALAAGKPVLSTDVGVAREAGAITAEGEYAEALRSWLESGPREGRLSGYPYTNFEEYVAQYCDDIAFIARQ